jgi:hypothetical protein
VDYTSDLERDRLVVRGWGDPGMGEFDGEGRCDGFHFTIWILSAGKTVAAETECTGFWILDIEDLARDLKGATQIKHYYLNK